MSQLLAWVVPITFLFALLEGVAFSVFRAPATGLASLVLLGYGLLLLLAAVQVRRGKGQAGVAIMCAGLLAATLVAVMVQPDWLPILSITPLIAVMIALPYVSGRSIRRLIIASCLVTAAVAVLGTLVPPRPGPPAWFQNLFLICSIVAAVAIVLLLLWQFRSRLTRTLAQTRAAEERYALAVRATNDGLWDWNLTTDEVYFSPRWKEMLGYEDGKIGTRPSEWLDRIHPDERAEVEERLRAYLDGTTGHFTSEHRLLHKDGEYLWTLAQGVAVRDANGKTIRIAGSQSNINERKRAEEELKKRATQLANYNDELERFAYSVSHDLRAPLRWITGFSKILIEDHAERLDPESKNHLYRILSASDSMGERVDSLLEISRLTRRKLHREPVNLGFIAQGIAEDLRKSHPKSNAEFIIAGNLPTNADDQLMRIAIENLLDNAWKFTRDQPHPRIEFGAMEENGETVYFVKDNGVGFDEAYAENLFGPFQRLHTNEEFEGTGLGLATVQRIVHRHGGRIWAEGEMGGGATFYFTL